MGIFSKIKDILWNHPIPGTAMHGSSAHAATPPPAPSAGAAPQPQAQAQAQPTPAQPVDIEAQLTAMNQGKNLNWQSSIVDLMKLVGIDSSYENRKELATELGDTNYSGSAEDNIALHKRVMQELAANGGKVPANLTD